MGCGSSVASERALRYSAVAEVQELRDRVDELRVQLEEAQRSAVAPGSPAAVEVHAEAAADGAAPSSPTCGEPRVKPLVAEELGAEPDSAPARPEAILPGGMPPVDAKEGSADAVPSVAESRDASIGVTSCLDDVAKDSDAQGVVNVAAEGAAGQDAVDATNGVAKSAVAGGAKPSDCAESVAAEAGEGELTRCGKCSPDSAAKDEVQTQVDEEFAASVEAKSETTASLEPTLIRTQSEGAMGPLLAAKEMGADEAADDEESAKCAKKASDGAEGGELANSQNSSEASTCVPKSKTTDSLEDDCPASKTIDSLEDDCPACHQCGAQEVPLYVDPSDLNQYCDSCWTEYYGVSPATTKQSLVRVHVTETLSEDRLATSWLGHTLPGWPPPAMPSTPVSHEVSETWSLVNVRLRTCVVGQHTREQITSELPYSGLIMNERYKVVRSVGEGHFTKAYLGEDISKGGMVCLKRHRSLTVEQLGDMLVLGKRMEEVDPSGVVFPRLFDAFYDVVGFTVESLVDGLNCLSVAHGNPGKFQDIKNVAVVARDSLAALVLLDRAGIVHNDVKPDNIMWDDTGPSCRIVDFGCARLDNRISPGRNWALAEGGAGHLGKWAPEMVLRLPITTANDVWGVAISLCELHCNRCVWRNESDTAEIVMTQAVGLCGLKEGVPRTMLQRSPLDIRKLYTPPPNHFPVRRTAGRRVEVLSPTNWGLEQVLGSGWREGPKASFGELLTKALAFDPLDRPPAADLLATCAFAGATADPASAPATSDLAAAPAAVSAEEGLDKMEKERLLKFI